jgi:transcriptional regulator with XRE-family HTH domain
VVPTVRLRRLAAQMRQLREQAELTREDVEQRTGINEATLYRLERARVQRPQRRTLATLLDLYGVRDPDRAEILKWVRESKPRFPHPLQDAILDDYGTYINFEAEASNVSNFEPLFVPGLLQTEQYARAVIQQAEPELTERGVDQRVQMRLQRQELLRRADPLSFHAIVDEAVLHRQVGGPEVMRAQLMYLAQVAAEPTVTFQVVPFEAGAHPGMLGSLTIVEFPDAADPAVVYLDNFAGQFFVESEAALARYRAYLDRLQSIALGPPESAKLASSLGGR